MATAIVTGGAGFIGSNLVDALISEGREVHAVDNLANGKRERLNSGATFHETDIRDQAAMIALVEAARPTTIFHLAAQADVRRAIEEPGYDADVNIVGTLCVLEAARRVGARVIFASTGGAGYGEYDGLVVPTPEGSETRPMSHYGMSKMAGEGYLGLYGRLYGLDTVVLRLGNVYGPRQDPHGEAGVVAIFLGKVLDGDRPKIFGDGRQTRDYVYVGDVVRAFLAAENGPAGETFNIGQGKEISVLDLIEGMAYAGPIEFADARAGELQRSCLNPARAARDLGWTASVDIPTGLALTRVSVEAIRRDPTARPLGALDVAP